MAALFGPGGNSESFYADGHKHTTEAPSWLKQKGLDAYEYQAGNGITGSDATLAKIGEAAAEAGIKMSIHAPYYISLSGIETEKRLKSIDYIRKSLHAAKLLGADTIVIHAGRAAKISREEAMYLASDTLYKAAEEFTGEIVHFGIETMGKVNQLGTLEEVIELCKVADIYYPVVDFGHLNSRNIGGFYTSEDDYKRTFDLIGDRLGDKYAQKLHCHFSKIEYTGSGEKKHVRFCDDGFEPPFEPLCSYIAKAGLEPRIICESAGTMADDALMMKKCYLEAIK
ncbi:MAG: TIM barrel protein [Clostridia bacterium]|nr:TIM barrel protein [Clostridia bacterium]